MTDRIAATPEARARVGSRTQVELAQEINRAVKIVKQTGLPRRKMAHSKAELDALIDAADADILRSLDDVREAWRRLEAQGDPRGLKSGKPTVESAAGPTPERRAKAHALDRQMIGRREVSKLKTTADLLADRGHLTRDLRAALERFCIAVAEAMHVNACDERSSSARMVSGYDGMPTAAYGPREISDRVLDARYLWKMIEREIPPEMMDILDQLVGEETGLLQGKPASLQRYGRAFGWEQDKQAGAAGGMLAITACAVLHHAFRRGIGKREG